MKKVYLFITAMMMLAFTAATAQQLDAIKQTTTYDIDNIGDAHVSTSRTYNAAQWDNYKKIYGSNANEMLKREMERSLPSSYLQNFKYKEEDRTFTLSFDALGMARIDDNGAWQLDIALKNPDITKISDRNYAMTATYNVNGMLLQEISKINLPEGADNVTQGKNAFGKAIFSYESTPPRKGAHLVFLIVGILLIGAGVVAYLKPDLLSQIGKGNKVKPFTVVSSQAPAAVTPEPPANPNIEKQA